jgi:hypothetical protein
MFVRVKCCVFFEVHSEILNIIQTSFKVSGSKFPSVAQRKVLSPPWGTPIKITLSIGLSVRFSVCPHVRYNSRTIQIILMKIYNFEFCAHSNLCTYQISTMNTLYKDTHTFLRARDNGWGITRLRSITMIALLTMVITVSLCATD